MSISKPDFLVLNLSGINMFVELVDEMVKANAGSTFEQCARYLQNQIREYSKTRDGFHYRPTQAVLPKSLTLSLSELMSRSTCGDRRYAAISRNVVYVVRDGDRVLYVGSTRYGARGRMKSHEKSHSPLGEALRADSGKGSWTVEMIPHADYEAAALKEKQLITKLAPAFCRRF